jgi:hypothetical protein
MKAAGHNPALDGLPAILLRDLCECAECRDVSSGQRLGSATDLPADVSVASTTVAGGAVEGGDSGLVDGFNAAALLRAADPAAFEILTRTPVTFAYADATAELRATRPMIATDPVRR